MIDKQRIAREFTKNASNFFASSNLQRAEFYRAYEYVSCHQYTQEEYDERKRLNKAITTINLAAPLVRAVSGTECMQDKKIDFVAIDENFNRDADIIGDAVEYAQIASGYNSQQSIAREDATTCGLGGTVTYLDMTQKDAIAGTPIVERIFPGFIGFDSSSRGSQINKKARWMFYADPVLVESLDEYIAEKLKGKTQASSDGAGDYKAFLMGFSKQENLHEIDFLYHYFWWDYDDIYDVANPFIEDVTLGQMIMNDPEIANTIGKMADDLQIDWKAAYWSLDKQAYDTFVKTVETVCLLVGVEMPEISYSKRKGKCYYRAEIARGMVISASRSYTQNGHALNLITGYFDEIMGIYYGLMRPISFVQDALNISMSDFLSYARSASHGGSAYIKGGADAIERLKKEKANEDAITPLPSNAEVIPKALPTAPQTLVEFIRLMIELMPRVVGLGQEFLGVITSGDMTDSLYGKVMKQSFAVLANFANNSAGYSIRQGEIFVDIIKLMAEANDGMILPILSPNKPKELYIRLTKQNLAARYAVRIVERPMTAEDKQANFNILSQLAPQFMQAGVNILPAITKLTNLDQDLKDELIALATPQPPQPNPLNDALLDSQAKLQYAQAAKLQSDAQETVQSMPKTVEKLSAEVDRIEAQTMQILEEIRSDSVPMAKMKEIESKERVEMARINASSKPATTVQFNAENALGSVADNIRIMAESALQANIKAADNSDRIASALIDSAGALKDAAKAMNAPKRTELIIDPATNRPIGSVTAAA